MDLSSIIKKRPDLIQYHDIESKFDAIVDFLSMDKVILEIPDMSEFDRMPKYDQKFSVTGLPGPQTSYIKSTAREWIKNFPIIITEFLSGDSDSDGMTECLERISKESFELHEKYNLSNDLTFDEAFRYYVIHNETLVNMPFVHLNFDNDSYNELIRHFELRSLFFLQLSYKVSEKLQLHLHPLQAKKQLYTWDSKNAELEMSELVFVLHILAQRIKLNDAAGGTFATFKREFFGLFGLNDKVYNKKIGTIKERDYKEHFITTLSQKLNEYHASVSETREEKSD